MFPEQIVASRALEQNLLWQASTSLKVEGIYFLASEATQHQK